MKFRKKSVTVEATQFSEDILWWFILEDKPLPEDMWHEKSSYNTQNRKLHYYNVWCGPKNNTFESIPVNFGDWIVYEPEPEGTKVYTDEYFKSIYEPVVEIF